MTEAEASVLPLPTDPPTIIQAWAESLAQVLGQIAEFPAPCAALPASFRGAAPAAPPAIFG